MATASKNSCYISKDFHMVINQTIGVYALPMSILTSLTVDEILQPKYMNWSTNFISLPFNEEMALSR